MHELPMVQRFEYDDPPEGDVLEFRLVFKGQLPSDQGGGKRAKYKHQIRKCFHKQLKELWSQHQALRMQMETYFVKGYREPSGVVHAQVVDKVLLPVTPSAKTWVEHVADDHTAYGGRWVPLVSKVSGLTCSLDILFLRRDAPGGLVEHGGDIDNRIKTLIDGLRKPEKVEDLGGYPVEADENPFYCLMEDDRLITSIKITTDRLLQPVDPGEKESSVELVVGVQIIDPNALFVGNRLV